MNAYQPTDEEIRIAKQKNVERLALKGKVSYKGYNDYRRSLIYNWKKDNGFIKELKQLSKKIQKAEGTSKTLKRNNWSVTINNPFRPGVEEEKPDEFAILDNEIEMITKDGRFHKGNPWKARSNFERDLIWKLIRSNLVKYFVFGREHFSSYR